MSSLIEDNRAKALLRSNKARLNIPLNKDFIFYKHFFFFHPRSIFTDFCYSLRYFLSIAIDTVFFSALGAEYWAFLAYFLSLSKFVLIHPFCVTEGKEIDF